MSVLDSWLLQPLVRRAVLVLLTGVVGAGCPTPDPGDDSVDTDVLADTDVVSDTDEAPFNPLPARPFPQHVTYPGAALTPGFTPFVLDADVRAAYDRWKQAYLVSAAPGPGGVARMRVRAGRGAQDVTFSEGQGYGVVIVALMAGHDPDARTTVDALWRYFNDHRSELDDRLMDWRVPASEVDGPDADPDEGHNSAFDGDADLAYGLLLADAQWGSLGPVDYRAEALDILDGMLDSEIGPASHLPMLGDWVDPGGREYSEWTTRSSDWMIQHFRAFARAGSAGEWNAVVGATLEVARLVQGDYAPNTGLLPDFVVDADDAPRPADPDFLEKETDGMYGYNAGRVPWRLGFDALVTGDARSLALVRTLTGWIDDATLGDPADIAPGYQLDGNPLSPRADWTSFFAAPFAVAAMTDATQQAWLNAVYQSVAQSEEGYYEDTVTLQCLLVLSGNAWSP